MLEKILQAFDENGIYTDKDDLNAQLDMDSIQYVSLIVSLEDLFDINFPDDYLGDNVATTVNEFLAAVTELTRTDN